LKAAKTRLGTMDLKIASIALANDAILLSRNVGDFQKVPGLQVVDWLSQP
jgi:tRNA(fMet)-specific endonuclease VapC